MCVKKDIPSPGRQQAPAFSSKRSETGFPAIKRSWPHKQIPEKKHVVGEATGKAVKVLMTSHLKTN